MTTIEAGVDANYFDESSRIARKFPGLTLAVTISHDLDSKPDPECSFKIRGGGGRKEEKGARADIRS